MQSAPLNLLVLATSGRLPRTPPELMPDVLQLSRSPSVFEQAELEAAAPVHAARGLRHPVPAVVCGAGRPCRHGQGQQRSSPTNLPWRAGPCSTFFRPGLQLALHLRLHRIGRRIRQWQQPDGEGCRRPARLPGGAGGLSAHRHPRPARGRSAARCARRSAARRARGRPRPCAARRRGRRR